MTEIYGHRWTSAYGDDSGANGAAGTWAKGLAGVTTADVARGLQACIVSADPWPPTLPEFRAMCLGIPTMAAVRLDKGQADPFTRLVWQNVDSYRYTRAMADAADRMLRDAYEVAREHAMRGGAMPPEPAALIEQERREVVLPDDETRAAIIERARAELGEAAP